MSRIARYGRWVMVALGMFLVVNAAVVFAQGQGGNIKLQNPLGQSCNDLTCPLQAVMNFLVTIAIPLTGILVIVGGFQMMTAAGNAEKFGKGKKTILYAAIGFVVVLLADSVALLIKSIFGGGQ